MPAARRLPRRLVRLFRGHAQADGPKGLQAAARREGDARTHTRGAAARRLPRDPQSDADAAWLSTRGRGGEGAAGAFDRCARETRTSPPPQATLTRPPSLEFAAYLALSAGCVLAWAVAASDVAAGAHAAAPRLASHLAVLAGFGPVAAASAVTGITRSGGGAPRGGPLKTGLLLACGTLFCSVPVSWACYLALQPPGEDV